MKKLIQEHRKHYDTIMKAHGGISAGPLPRFENEDICIEDDTGDELEHILYTKPDVDPGLKCLTVQPIFRMGIVQKIHDSRGVDGQFRCNVLYRGRTDFFLRLSSRALRKWPAGLAVAAQSDDPMTRAMLNVEL